MRARHDKDYGLREGDLRRRSLSALFVAALVLFAGCWATTQWIAWRVGNHPSLGASWLSWGETQVYQVYPPLSFVRWWPRLVDGALLRQVRSFLVLSFAASLVAGVGWLRFRGTRTSSLHGSARWADKSDLKKAGLLGAVKQGGVYVGAWQSPATQSIHYLRHDGPEHLLAFAPTRSGKGVGLVIPTLLGWRGSAVVLDIKGENFALTSGWRHRGAGQRVLRFDPGNPETVRFNPLQEIRLGSEYETADIQNIATMLVDPHGKGLEDHWSKTSWALLVGAITHVCYRELGDKKPGTLALVAEELSDSEASYEEVMERWIACAHDPSLERGWKVGHHPSPTHPGVAAAARDMLNREPKEASSVLSTALSYLSLYRDPLIAQATAESDFRVEDLVDRARPATLYLVVRPTDLSRVRPLVRLVLSQIVRGLTRELPTAADGAHRRGRLLLLLDEFVSVGRLRVFEEALAYCGGYGIKCYLIVQDLSQLYGVYGKSESILANCHLRVAFAPNKIETAELLSKMSGTTTVREKDRNRGNGGARYGRPLLTPDECMRLRGAEKEADGSIRAAGDMLVFVGGTPPVYGRQILYFQDRVLASRAALSPPEGSHREQLASHEQRARGVVGVARAIVGLGSSP